MVRRTGRGFTLLELLVVIGILVILASAAVPIYFRQQNKAKIGLATSAVGPNGTLTAALELYRSNCDAYPTTEQGLDALKTKPNDDKLADKWNGPYIKENVDLKDPWGTPYQYKCPGEHNTESFDLSSAGQDAEHGTDDDVVNWVADTAKTNK